MGIEDLTIGEARQLAAMFGGKASTVSPYEVGKKYFIRTVTHHYVGELVQVTEQELVLVKASWIPDDGRFHEAFIKGDFKEIEPYPADNRVMIGRGAICDATEWKHALPTQTK